MVFYELVLVVLFFGYVQDNSFFLVKFQNYLSTFYPNNTRSLLVKAKFNESLKTRKAESSSFGEGDHYQK